MRSPRYGKLQHHAQHAAVEGLALVGRGRVAHAHDAADVQHLDDVAGLERARHVTGIAEQRAPRAERADDDIALADLGHAAAGELQGVVVGLVGQHLGDDRPRLPRRESRSRGAAPAPSAQAWVTEAILSTTTLLTGRSPCRTRSRAPAALAGAPVEHPGQRDDLGEAERIGRASIRRPPRRRRRCEAAISENGESTPSTNSVPGRSSTCTSPVTRSCEDTSSASMSRQTGSSSWPSCTRSP